MPRACSICVHPQHHGIDHALRTETALRTIAVRWSVSKTALIRHRNAHMEVAPSWVPAVLPVPEALSLDVQQALDAYHEAVRAYEALRQTDWRRSAYSPGALMSPAWRKVQACAQRLRTLGVDPGSLTAPP
jgi:hypothetical protein